MPLNLPPELVAMLSQYIDQADPTVPRVTIYVSYIPQKRTFSAHKEGLCQVRAASLSELCKKIAEALPEAEFSLHLSKVARAEVARRKTGGPMAGRVVLMTPGGRPR